MATSNRPFPYFNIETKTQPATDNIYHPAPEAFVDMLMKVIKEKGMEDFVIIQSFDFTNIAIPTSKLSNNKNSMIN